MGETGESRKLSPVIASNESDLISSMQHAIELIDVAYGNEHKKHDRKEKKPEEEYIRKEVAKDLSKIGYNVLYYHPVFVESKFLDVLPDFAWDPLKLSKYPNVYLMGKRHSNQLIVLFTGTEVGLDNRDLLQDGKSATYADSYPRRYSKKIPYVPNGHLGFRDGVYNLMNRGFFDAAEKQDNGSNLDFDCEMEDKDFAKDINGENPTIKNFICLFEIQAPNDKGKPVEIYVMGHSLGAGIAQVSLGVFAGLHWDEDSPDLSIESHIRTDPNYLKKYDLKGVFLFAPPRSVYSHYGDDDLKTCAPVKWFGDRKHPEHHWDDESVRYNIRKKALSGKVEKSEAPSNRWEPDPIEVYDKFGISKRTVTVINEADFVPVIWSPVKAMVHCNEGEHFGIPVIIDRRGIARIIYHETDPEYSDHNWKWRYDQPHRSSAYKAAIDDLN